MMESSMQLHRQVCYFGNFLPVVQLEQRRQEFMSTITQLEEKLRYIQQQIVDQKKNVNAFDEQLVNLPEKEQLVQVLHRDLQQKEEVSRKNQVENSNT